MKRNERIGAIILTLSESPSKVFSLQQFCDAFGVAKSSISEDIAIASEAVKATGSGYIETIPGAKGGVRFIPDIQDDELEKLQIEFCDRISDSSRILGGGFLYTSDIMHDVIILDNPPHRQPIGITKPSDRIGKPYMECGWDKIAGIVITDIQDGLRPLGEISEDSQKIADNIIEFLNGEVKAGRLSDTLLPIQSGVGSVANAVLYGLLESDFHDLTWTQSLENTRKKPLRISPPSFQK